MQIGSGALNISSVKQNSPVPGPPYILN